MANYNNNTPHGGYVDISSNSQINKVYKKRGVGKRIAAGILSVLFLAFGCGFVYYYSVLESLNFADVSDTEATTVPGATTDPNIGSDTQNLIMDGKNLLSDPKVLNVLLIGEDYSEGEGHGNSDSMILCTIDNRHKKLKLTTFMRDSYVYIPNHGLDKLNASYMLGGPSLTIQTIQTNFGVKIDRYATVDYASFEKIVDIMGGVTIDLTADEAGYINWQMYINDQAPDRNTLQEVDGPALLTGQEALWYARDRGFQDDAYPGVVYSGDDWERTKRQRNFFQTVFNSLKSSSLPQLVQVVGEIGPLVTTNLKKDEITTLVSNALTYLQYDVEQYCVPQEGYWSYLRLNEIDYIQIDDLVGCRNEFAKFIFEDLVSGGTTSSNTSN